MDKLQLFQDCLRVAYSDDAEFVLTYFSQKQYKIKKHIFKGRLWTVSSVGADCIVLLNNKSKKEHFLHRKDILAVEICRRGYDFSKLILSWLSQLSEPWECLSFYLSDICLGHVTSEYFSRVLNGNLEILFDGDVFVIPLCDVFKVKYERVG